MPVLMLADGSLIKVHIVACHTGGGKSLGKSVTHAAAVQGEQGWYFRARLRFATHYEAGDVVFDDFRHGTSTEGQHRCAAGERLDHDQSERLRPFNGKQQPKRLAQELLLPPIVNFSNELYQWIAQHRLNLFEIVGVHRVDLGRHLQRYIAARAMRMAGSMPFSGEMRPRKAK